MIDGPIVSKYIKLEGEWVIKNSVYDGRSAWVLLHDHDPTDKYIGYGYVHSYMKLGSYKCNKCGEMAPDTVNGFYELCKWER